MNLSYFCGYQIGYVVNHFIIGWNLEDGMLCCCTRHKCFTAALCIISGVISYVFDFIFNSAAKTMNRSIVSEVSTYNMTWWG